MPARTPVTVEHVDTVVAKFRAVYEAMRIESQSAVDGWLCNAERRVGGTLIIQAPTSSAKRDLPEAALASERFSTVAAPLIRAGAAGAEQN